MTGRPRRIQDLAGRSMSLEEANELIAQMSQPVPIEADDNPEIELQQALAEAEAIHQDEIPGDSGDASDGDIWEVLFGPHNATIDATEKHYAAFELWNRYVRASAEDSALAVSLAELHADNGYGFCTGCGHDERDIYLVPLDQCLTLALLKELS